MIYLGFFLRFFCESGPWLSKLYVVSVSFTLASVCADVSSVIVGNCPRCIMADIVQPLSFQLW